MWQFWDTNIINCIRQVHICIFLSILWFRHIIFKIISVSRQFHALVGVSSVKKVEKHCCRGSNLKSDEIRYNGGVQILEDCKGT